MYVGKKLVRSGKTDDISDITLDYLHFEWGEKQKAIYTFKYQVKIKGNKTVWHTYRFLRHPESTVINRKKGTVKVKFDKYVNCIAIPYDTEDGKSKIKIYDKEGTFKLPKASRVYDQTGIMIKNNQLFALSRNTEMYMIEKELTDLGLVDGKYSYCNTAKYYPLFEMIEGKTPEELLDERMQRELSPEEYEEWKQRQE